MNTTVNYKQLLHAMKKAEKTREKGSYNPLSNVSMKFKGRYIEFCTTDGNYLCLTKIESEKQIDNIELLFEPTQVLNWLKGLGKVIGNIKIEYNTGLEFSCCGSELFVMLTDLTYPKYEQLISNYNIDNDFRKIGRSENVQKVCVNTKYLKNILDTIDSDEIEIKFNRDNNLVALELADNIELKRDFDLDGAKTILLSDFEVLCTVMNIWADNRKYYALNEFKKHLTDVEKQIIKLELAYRE